MQKHWTLSKLKGDRFLKEITGIDHFPQFPAIIYRKLKKMREIYQLRKEYVKVETFLSFCSKSLCIPFQLEDKSDKNEKR